MKSYFKSYVYFVCLVGFVPAIDLLREDLTIQPRRTSNLRSSCFSLPSAAITEEPHHTQLMSILKAHLSEGYYHIHRHHEAVLDSLSHLLLHVEVQISLWQMECVLQYIWRHIQSIFSSKQLMKSVEYFGHIMSIQNRTNLQLNLNQVRFGM